jgi:hypothetical protein
MSNNKTNIKIARTFQTPVRLTKESGNTRSLFSHFVSEMIRRIIARRSSPAITERRKIQPEWRMLIL